MRQVKAVLIAGALVLASGAAFAEPMGGTEGGATAGAPPAAAYHRHTVTSRGEWRRGYDSGYDSWAYAPPATGWQRAQQMGAEIVSGGGVSLR